MRSKEASISKAEGIFKRTLFNLLIYIWGNCSPRWEKLFILGNYSESRIFQFKCNTLKYIFMIGYKWYLLKCDFKNDLNVLGYRSFFNNWKKSKPKYNRDFIYKKEIWTQPLYKNALLWKYTFLWKLKRYNMLLWLSNIGSNLSPIKKFNHF